MFSFCATRFFFFSLLHRIEPQIRMDGPSGNSTSVHRGQQQQRCVADASAASAGADQWRSTDSATFIMVGTHAVVPTKKAKDTLGWTESTKITGLLEKQLAKWIPLRSTATQPRFCECHLRSFCHRPNLPFPFIFPLLERCPSQHPSVLFTAPQ